jgi:predicted nucleic acid-binding Zn finger protein
MEETKQIGLAEMLRALRSELLEAQQSVQESGQPALLNLEDAEVEIKFTVKKGGSGKVGADVYFFAVELGGKYDTEQVHRLKLKLHPIKGGISVAES